MAGESVKQKHETWKEYLNKVDTPKLKKARTSGNVVFATLYIELIVLLIVGGIIFINYCRKSFVLYENSQLHYALDSVLDELNGADAGTLTLLLNAEAPQGTNFDEPDRLLRERYEALAEKEFTAKENRGHDATRHEYTLLADGVAVGSFAIVSGSEETRLGLLKITEWKYDGGQVDFEYDRFSRSYTVPTGFRVLVDGVELGDSYTAGEDKKISRFEFVEDYADMPRLRTYVIEDFLEVPVTVIYDNLGNEVQFDTEAENPDLPRAYSSSDVPQEYVGMAAEMAQLWANYTLRDATLDDIKQVLIPDSFLFVQVKDSDHDRRYVDAHELQGFTNVKVSEYISYGDNCFSCRVSMDRTVKVTSKGTEVSDHLDNIFFFVKLDITDDGTDNPRWYIADMQSA